MKRTYILNAFLDTPWAILPQKLSMIEDVVMRHVSGEKLSAEEIQARTQSYNRSTGGAQQLTKQVAVMPVYGTIFPRAHLIASMSGGTSADRLAQQFMGLVNDPQISAIVLDVDSPGGQVGGIEELADTIFQARGSKPVIAVANHMMASAAYWIGTAADEVVVTPSGQVGSVGVFSAHVDWSGNLEKEGIKVSLISAGKYKVEGNPYEPLSEETRKHIQAKVDQTYESFLDAVARNRGVKTSVVRKGFGEGRVVEAKEAVALGMADRVGTLDETIGRLLEGGNSTPANGSQAQSQNVPAVQASSESDQVGGIDALHLSEEENRAADELRKYLEVLL